MLILGESGSGKSDLALRLIDRGCVLVGDDRIILSTCADSLVASGAPELKGKLEVRGVGIMRAQAQESCRLTHVVKLVAREQVERMPEPTFFDCLGLKLPLISLCAFDASAPAKLLLWMKQEV